MTRAARPSTLARPSCKKIRSRFGLVFQSFNLFPHYSVLRNLTDAPVNVHKRSKSEAQGEGDGAAREDGPCG